LERNVTEYGGALPLSVLQRSTEEPLLTGHGLLEVEDQPCWFAVQTRPRYEKKVSVELHEKGIATFLPLNSAMHQWSDRRRLVHVPLFSGYVFVRIAETPAARISVLRTNGVRNFVGIRNMGVAIPDSEIDAVRAVVEERVPFEPYPYLKIGQRVCIRGGSLDGVSGVLNAVNGDQSLIISVNLIQRSIAMRIEGYRVEAI
jgi:transcription antitermination factor NusG